MNILEAIQKRSSVRAYTDQPIEKEKIDAILQAGMRAPSGKNGQPWRFAVVQEDKSLLQQIAACTVCEKVVGSADCLICVFLDKEHSYDYKKDCQAIGACIENMLLAAEALGLGACWIGEILNREKEVKELLSLPDRYDLMAVVTLGYPARPTNPSPKRKALKECVLSFR